MSKRIKKDIKHISDEVGLQNIASDKLENVDSQVPSLTIDGAPSTRKSSSRKAAKVVAPMVASFPADTEEDPELQKLLKQVDQMLTDMTNSKWLSADYPSLQIDFGAKPKK